MNTTDSEGDCDSDCHWDHWAGFWIEGVILPLIAALGIAGVENCLQLVVVAFRGKKSRKLLSQQLCETKTD